jgi:hypothetical protein
MASHALQHWRRQWLVSLWRYVGACRSYRGWHLSLLFLLLISNVAFGQVCHDARNHPDYVPDAKTAEAIAKAVLIARFGEARVQDQLPLKAFPSPYGDDRWFVGGGFKTDHVGGGMSVWIDRHCGYIEGVFERMK